jgi:polyisoprenoid-binding protein YceI
MNLLHGTLCVAGLAGLAGLVSPAHRSAGPAPAETFTIDNVHSTVVFHTRHLGISEAYGRFDEISDKSRLVLDADPAKSSILLVVEAESINTNSADRDKHLRSGDFFSTKEFPEIVFESKSVAAAGKGWKVTGDLSFHGVTRPLMVEVRQVGKGDTFLKDHRAGFVAEFTVDMRDFGVEFLKQNPGAVGPEVQLVVSLECVRQ